MVGQLSGVRATACGSEPGWACPGGHGLSELSCVRADTSPLAPLYPLSSVLQAALAPRAFFRASNQSKPVRLRGFFSPPSETAPVAPPEEGTQMPTICRLLRLPPERAASLIAQPGDLSQSVESAKIYTDVYRYWHAIQYLLAQHRPTSPAATWLSLGQGLSTGTRDVPAARVLRPRKSRYSTPRSATLSPRTSYRTTKARPWIRQTSIPDAGKLGRRRSIPWGRSSSTTHSSRASREPARLLETLCCCISCSSTMGVTVEVTGVRGVRALTRG